MPETEERATLTQRRAGVGIEHTNNGAAKLQHSKLQSVSDFDETEGSAGKVVIWVVIVVVVAAVAYLGLKNFVNNDGGDDQATEQTPTPEPTVDPLSGLVADALLNDDLALAAPASGDYSVATKSVGNANSDDTFVLDSVFVQPYTTFTRVEYMFTGDGGTEPVPHVTAEYATADSTVTLTFENISDDQNILTAGNTLNVSDSIVASISHEVAEGSSEVYVVTLSEDSKYFLHTVEENDVTKVVLDVQEVEVTPTEVVGTSVTPVPTATTAPSTGGGLSNVFSKGNQTITGTATSNSVRITRYNFIDLGSLFTYRLFLGDDMYPNVSSTLDGTTLTIVVSNVASDAIVGNGGSGTTNFNAKGVENINKVDITNASNKSTFVFDLDANYEYRIYINETEKQMVLEVKH